VSDVRDLRDVLEAVTFGEDDRIRPADRVRAAELLRELNALGLDDLFRLETASMSGEELDAAFDASTAVLLGEILAGRGAAIAEDFPQTVAAVEAMVDSRARKLAAGLTAAPQIEADFEQQVWRRVAERRDAEARMAEWLTLDEAVELVREQIAEMKVESDRELVERGEELWDRLWRRV
jgi:hypothetical protein